MVFQLVYHSQVVVVFGRTPTEYYLNICMIPLCVGLWNKDVAELEISKRRFVFLWTTGVRTFSSDDWCCNAVWRKRVVAYISSLEFSDYAHQIHSTYKIHQFTQAGEYAAADKMPRGRYRLLWSNIRNPDLIQIGHPSELSWKVLTVRNDWWTLRLACRTSGIFPTPTILIPEMQTYLCGNGTYGAQDALVVPRL